MEKTEVGRGELVVPREDAPVVLDLVDEALHQVVHLPVGSGRDHGDRATLSDYLDEGVGVVPLVGDHILYRSRKEQRLSLGDVMGLACRELELERVAQSVHTQVDFAGEATAASALAPLLRGAPAAQGWARIMVLSNRRCSMSGSLVKVSCIRFQTPCSHQRRKRLYTVFHRPYSSGSARHWAPVRAIHKIPVRKRRQFSSCPT